MKTARIVSPALGLILVAFAAAPRTSGKIDAEVPPRLEHYLTHTARLSADQRRALESGAPITKLLDVHETEEVAVFGAVWIDAPVERYVEQLKDIEAFESGKGFNVTRRIGSPPKLEDFAGLRLPEKDLKDLRSCRVGDCDVKLGEEALRRFRTEVDWDAADAPEAANALMRRIAFEYVSGYLEGGNGRLAVYRDSSRPTFVAREFREMTDGMPELTTYMPALRRHLLEYPGLELTGSTSFLYWQETEFGLKPTIRISHVTIKEHREGAIVASKMLYASHYFWTGLELRALLPDRSRGRGFWFVTVNRSRSDGMTGFLGLFVRPRVRSRVQSGMLSALVRTKEKVEAGS